MDIGTWHIDVWVVWALAAIPMSRYLSIGMVELAKSYLATYQKITIQNHRPTTNGDRWRGTQRIDGGTADTRG